MLEINPGLILWTIITFVIVVVILRGTAWKPLVKALNDREEKIRQSLELAERAHADAQRMLEENRVQLAAAGEQAARIIMDGRDMGERLKNEILEKAQASSRQTVEMAKAEINREKEAALTQLRGEVADLAIAAAGKILEANLDEPRQRKLVDSVIRELSGST